MQQLDNDKRTYLRKFERHTYQSPVLLTHPEIGELAAMCTNVSGGGFRAVVPIELKMGQILKVEFSQRKLVHSLTLHAQVVYLDGLNHGFEFVAPNEAGRQLVADFVAEVLAESGRMGTREKKDESRPGYIYGSS